MRRQKREEDLFKHLEKEINVSWDFGDLWIVYLFLIEFIGVKLVNKIM